MAFMSIAKRELPDYKFKSIKVMAEQSVNNRQGKIK